MDPIVLTPKQQRFCDEYLIDMTATRAALRAGYSTSTALNGQLMQIPKIKYYLQQRTTDAACKAQVTYDMILGELSKIAFGNIRNYYRSDGTMKSPNELTADEGAALWCMKETDGKDGKSSCIRMHNKLSALEKIAKHLRFYEGELEPPEQVYVYFDPKTLDAQDTFDDELFGKWDYEAEYYDEAKHAYYPWDTECKVAVAQARAACKARHAVARGRVTDGGGLMTDDRGRMTGDGVAAKGGETAEDGGLMTEDGEAAEDGGQIADDGAIAETGGAEVVVPAGADDTIVKPDRSGGVIDFGSAKKGSCQVPLMKGNSREYGYW